MPRARAAPAEGKGHTRAQGWRQRRRRRRRTLDPVHVHLHLLLVLAPLRCAACHIRGGPKHLSGAAAGDLAGGARSQRGRADPHARRPCERCARPEPRPHEPGARARLSRRARVGCRYRAKRFMRRAPFLSVPRCISSITRRLNCERAISSWREMSASIALRLAGSLGVYRLVPWLTFTVMIGRAKSAPSVREEIAFGSRLCGASSGDSRGRAAASRAAGAMAAGRRLKVDANMAEARHNAAANCTVVTSDTECCFELTLSGIRLRKGQLRAPRVLQDCAATVLQETPPQYWDCRDHLSAHKIITVGFNKKHFASFLPNRTPI